MGRATNKIKVGEKRKFEGSARPDKLLQQYREFPSSGPRELTLAMVRSIEEADKPAKRGKKAATQKETKVAKTTKGQTPTKRRSDKAALSQPEPKKQKKPARRLILQSSSDSDSEYVPPKHTSAPPSESESESSDEEASGRGNTPPRSPTPEIPVPGVQPKQGGEKKKVNEASIPLILFRKQRHLIRNLKKN
ncbi:unnamed protein product [Lactuca virosa]|uniref:Uncharacterized protein n=1 Tax=Lactuca virosa TaxID=75947 RepID=A0AAU9M6W9_9ASTR|nr:unnamed protein product [Lactuca virosa]